MNSTMAAPKFKTYIPVTDITADLNEVFENEPSPMSSVQDIESPSSPHSGDQYTSTPSSRRPSLPRNESFPAPGPAPLNRASNNLPHRMGHHSPIGAYGRPHSAGGLSSSGTLMQRAHSSPGVDSSGRLVHPTHVPRRPTSPLYSGRRRSPHRSGMEESYPGVSSWSGLTMEPNIPENEELEITPDSDLPHPSPITSYSNTFPRSRRRPTSPLHQSASAPTLHNRSISPHTYSLSFAAQKYANEPYPTYSFSSASSMPSTPTSVRSRSPSISSLDTIEDIPDAEEAAMLQAEENKHRNEDYDGSSDARRRSSLEVRGNNLKSNKERKRWSVCGAERRADFSLEPIEE